MKNLKYCILVLSFVMMVCVIIGISTTTVYADNGTYDISVREPIVLIEGQDISTQQIAMALRYGNKTVTIYDFIISVGGSDIASGVSTSTKIPMNHGLSDANPSVTGDLYIVYKNPDTNLREEATMPFVIKKNYLPVINAPHIYVSSQEFDTFKTISGNSSSKSLYQHILKQVKVTDQDNTATTTTLYTYNKGTFSTNAFSKGKTTMICITVVDLNKTVTVPCYVTVLDDVIEGSKSETSEVRSISEKYYPYYLSNIKKDSDGNYYAKMENNIYYFIDTNGDFLLGKDGNKFPVDACLGNAIQPTATSGLYKVIPLSKWIRNGNCRALLTGCFNNEAKNFVASWTFSADDLKVIQNTIKDGNLDKNFYYNYYANGYCELGTRNPNETNRTEATFSLGANTGLRWYVSNDTLFIVAEPIANSSYTYAIPDFGPTSNKISNFNDYNVLNGNNYADVPYVFYSKNGYNIKCNQPWKNETFSKIVLDDKITKIGSYAFFGFNCITEAVEIPESCSVIGEAAFMDCVNMHGDIYTKNVYKIGAYAFANCESLSGKLRLGADAINVIEDGAFYNCGFTSSLMIPASVTKIGKYAFMNCDKFTGNLALGDNITELGMYAFAGCSGFDGDLKIPASLNRINSFTFAGCSKLNGKLYLGNNLVYIGNYAFAGCTLLTGDVQLPEPLMAIGVGAFKDCKSLKNTLQINENLVSIGTDAFYGCTGIKVINNEKENSYLVIAPRAFYTGTTVSTRVTHKLILAGQDLFPTNFGKYNFNGDNRLLTD